MKIYTYVICMYLEEKIYCKEFYSIHFKPTKIFISYFFLSALVSSYKSPTSSTLLLFVKNRSEDNTKMTQNLTLGVSV